MKKLTRLLLLPCVLALCLASTLLWTGAHALGDDDYTPQITYAGYQSPDDADSHNAYEVSWPAVNSDESKQLEKYVVRGFYNHTVTDSRGGSRVITVSREEVVDETATSGYAVFPNYITPDGAWITVTSYYTDGTSYESAPLSTDSLPDAEQPSPEQDHQLYLYAGDTLEADTPCYAIQCNNSDHLHTSIDTEDISFNDATNTLTLNNVVIQGDLVVECMGVLNIVVIGDCSITGMVYVDMGHIHCTDIFFINGNTDGSRAKLSATFQSHGNNRNTDGGTFTFVGLDYTAAGTGESRTCAGAAVGFIDCSVNISTAGTTSNGYGIYTSSNGYTLSLGHACRIDGAALYIENCDSVNVTAPFPVLIDSSQADFWQKEPLTVMKNSSVTLQSIKGNTTSDGTAILETDGLYLENTTLNVLSSSDHANTSGINTNNGILYVDATSSIDVEILKPCDSGCCGIIVGNGYVECGVHNYGDIRIKLLKLEGNTGIFGSIYGIRSYKSYYQEGGSLDIDMNADYGANTYGYGLRNEAGGPVTLKNADVSIKVFVDGYVYGILADKMSVTGADGSLYIDVASSRANYSNAAGIYLSRYDTTEAGDYVLELDGGVVDVNVASGAKGTGIFLVESNPLYGNIVASYSLFHDCQLTVRTKVGENQDGTVTLDNYGVYASELTIDSCTVDINISADSAFTGNTYALYCYNGDLTVKDSKLTAVAEIPYSTADGSVCGIYLSSPYGGVGTSFTNSTLEARSVCGLGSGYGFNRSSNGGPLTFSSETILSAEPAAESVSTEVSACYTYSHQPTFTAGATFLEGDDESSVQAVDSITVSHPSTYVYSTRRYIRITKQPVLSFDGVTAVAYNAPAACRMLVARYSDGRLLSIGVTDGSALHLTPEATASGITVRLFLLDYTGKSFAPLCKPLEYFFT